MKNKKNGFIAGMLLMLAAPIVHAYGVSHHGGLILDCTPPLFFDESPGRDARVSSVTDFSLTASDNTDGETVKVWANNQPVTVEITEQRSGRLTIKGHLPETVQTDKVWFKVTGISKDGCDQLHNWNVYLDPSR